MLLVRRSPEAVGLLPTVRPANPNSEPKPELEPEPGTLGSTLRDALRTPAFWIFAVGAALYGLVASGIGLFNESILAERGFGPQVYYQTLVVTAMTGLAGNFIGGWLARFVPLNRLMAISLLVLTVGLLALPHVTTLPMAMAWAIMMGLGGGLVMVLFFSVWPRVYGRRELGRIQGAGTGDDRVGVGGRPAAAGRVRGDDGKLRGDVLHARRRRRCGQRRGVRRAAAEAVPVLQSIRQG